jgi:ATP-dependent DNA helicase PIF1
MLLLITKIVFSDALGKPISRSGNQAAFVEQEYQKRKRRFSALFRLGRLSQMTHRACLAGLSDALQLSNEQTRVWISAMCGANIFLTGGAGVGKSHTLRTIVQYIGNSEQTAVTASTGCAAAIIGATTLHSFAGVGLCAAPAQVYIKKVLSAKSFTYTRIRATKTLVIDEVGMLDGATFEKVGMVVGGVLRRNQQWTYHGGASGSVNASTILPWGQLQVITCGDFMQLPPVQVASKGWVFDSNSWKGLQFRVCVLREVHRQRGDCAFADVLARVRVGKSTPQDIHYIHSNSSSSSPQGALQLFPQNLPADQVNERELFALSSFIHTFNAVDRGPEHILAHLPAPKVLRLALGARVMCLRNVSVGLVNGSLGTVNDIDLHRSTTTGNVLKVDILVRFDGVLGGQTFDFTFTSYDENIDGHIDGVEDPYFHHKFTVFENGTKEVARRIQIPLRLAWAISIHKSQGMSLDKAMIDLGNVFADGGVRI